MNTLTRLRYSAVWSRPSLFANKKGIFSCQWAHSITWVLKVDSASLYVCIKLINTDKADNLICLWSNTCFMLILDTIAALFKGGKFSWVYIV